MPTIEQRLQSIEFGKRMEFWVAAIPKGPTLRYHNYVEPGLGNITWQGFNYAPWPIKAEGFEYDVNSPLPRPKLTVGDIDSSITAFMLLYDNLLGTMVTRKATLAEYLDGQPAADPTRFYQDEIFKIDAVPQSTPGLEHQFELIADMDRESVMIPLHQVKSNLCGFDYRGTECEYSGAPKTDALGNLLSPTVDRGAYNAANTYSLGHYTYTLSDSGIRVYWVSLANSNTAPLTDATKWVLDVCNLAVGDCKIHFGANNPLSTDACPGVAKLPQNIG